MKRLAVVTGSRSEYGVLKPLLRLMRESSVFELHLIAAGMHLSAEHGETWREIVADGFRIGARVKMQHPTMAAGGLGWGVYGLGRVFSSMRPDLVYVEGDRVEALAAALAAGYAGTPVAHSGGGVVTGTIDNAARHSISQFASLHFVEWAEARERLIAHGRDPDSIHVVGALGIDAIHQMQWRSRESVLADLGLPPDSRYLLVTFHPESEHPEQAGEWMHNLLQAAGEWGDLVITYPNSDPGSAAIIAEIEQFAAAFRHTVKAFPSLGSDRYLHATKYADAVVGNSSSGLLEAPSMPVQVLNIGHRQDGRPRAQNIRDCGYGYEEINRELRLMLYTHAVPLSLLITENPYGDGHAAERIMAVLERKMDEESEL